MFIASSLTLLCVRTTGPASSAFGADCLPRDEHGVPTDPSRDTALNVYQGVLPGLVMPLLGGQIFVWYKDHSVVYKAMFVWGTILSVVTTAIFYYIDPDEDERLARLAKVAAERGDGADAGEPPAPGAWYRGPFGAALCDRLCFPAVFAPAVSGQDPPAQQSVQQAQRS